MQRIERKWGWHHRGGGREGCKDEKEMVLVGEAPSSGAGSCRGLEEEEFSWMNEW